MDSIHDVHGLRLIVEKKEDCYRALGIVHQLWSEIPGKFKDYITHPKFNGYVFDKLCRLYILVLIMFLIQDSIVQVSISPHGCDGRWNDTAWSSNSDKRNAPASWIWICSTLEVQRRRLQALFLCSSDGWMGTMGHHLALWDNEQRLFIYWILPLFQASMQVPYPFWWLSVLLQASQRPHWTNLCYRDWEW